MTELEQEREQRPRERERDASLGASSFSFLYSTRQETFHRNKQEYSLSTLSPLVWFEVV